MGTSPRKRQLAAQRKTAARAERNKQQRIERIAIVKIDFSQIVGIPTRGGILRQPGSDKELSLGKVCIAALNHWSPSAPIDRAEAKMRGDLARKINAANGPLNVVHGDVVMIQDLLPLAWPSIVVSIADDMLEGKKVDTGAEFDTVEETEEDEGQPARPQAGQGVRSARKR